MTGDHDRTKLASPGLPPELVAAAYSELRRLARLYLAGQGGGRGTVLQATSLVHEAFLRLARNGDGFWKSKTHFAAVAAKVMRCILVDEIRSGSRLRRGGGHERIALDYVCDEGLAPANGSHTARSTGEASTLDLLALDEALTELAELSARQARVVELRYFGGLTVPEVAEVLEVGRRTVENDWSIARAWLKQRLDGLDGDTAPARQTRPAPSRSSLEGGES